MDGTSRHAAQSVSDARAALLAALAEAPQAFDLFQALRLLERVHPDQPRLGRSTRPAEDPLRLRHTPSLAFAPRSIDRLDPGDGQRPPALHGLAFGLFGPNAPLPLHLTEYAIARQDQARDPSLVAFADIFHHRLLSLFYRAWAEAQPVVQAERPDDDRYRLYLGALVGMATPGLQDRDALPDDTRRHYAGRLLALGRNREGLRGVLEGAFQVPLQVVEFIAEWMPLPADARLRLGGPAHSCVLGHSAVLGARVRSCQHRFRLRIGPLGLVDFRRWLPGGHALQQLRAAVRTYVGDAQAWDVQLLLRADQVPPMRLGRSGRIGLDSWMGQRAWSVVDADEVIVHPSG
ncbi:type VI secretion system baseplate subunit TssG [Bacillus subtilis subsp. subtilis]|nr:type VI secretion system baseplate subunit TssG [Bacillus subtilis subsp. subtilis]